MQNPTQEVEGVVKALVQARSATEQMMALKTYYTPSASFDHPLCAVTSRKDVRICGCNATTLAVRTFLTAFFRFFLQSRDHGLLQIYQWLRCISNSTISVNSKGEPLVDASQGHFEANRLSPFPCNSALDSGKNQL